MLSYFIGWFNIIITQVFKVTAMSFFDSFSDKKLHLLGFLKLLKIISKHQNWYTKNMPDTPHNFPISEKKSLILLDLDLVFYSLFWFNEYQKTTG